MTLTSTQTQPVSFLDLAALHAPLRDGLDAIWARTLTESSFIGGSAVEAIARQPEMAGQISTAMLITAALIEGALLFAVVVGLLATL